MLTTFWSGVGGKLAESWAATILSPAFVFWFGGFAAWTNDRGTSSVVDSVDDATRRLGNLPTTVQVAVLVVGLLVVTVSGIVVQAVTLPVIRLLEGYWPRQLEPLSRFVIRHRSKKLDADAARWRALAIKQGSGDLEARERGEYARLDRRRRASPVLAELRMPTRLGDMLRAAESRPGSRYGLDSIVCWPRLWLVLPNPAQQEVSASRRALDLRAEIWLWGVLFLVWGFFAWWALLLGAVVAFAAYRSMLGAAAIYGDIVVACYDLYRGQLYTALRWPLPPSPAEEVSHGRQLTRYLSRGTASPSAAFAGADAS